METIFTDKSAPPVGPYCQAVKHGGVLYLAGIIGLTPSAEKVQGGMEAEAEQIFKNLKAVLEAGGSSVDRLLRVTIYIGDFASWPRVNEMYAEFLGEHRCARSVLQVAALPLGMNIELEATAACE